MQGSFFVLHNHSLNIHLMVFKARQVFHVLFAIAYYFLIVALITNDDNTTQLCKSEIINLKICFFE